MLHRANLPKEMMHYPDFPFDAEDLPSFVGHADVLQYMKRYATKFDLYRDIAFHTLVESIEPRPCSSPQTDGEIANGVRDDVRWMVRTKDLETGMIAQEIFDSVLVCVGHYSKPFIPTIPGLDEFPGRVTHSHAYRTSESYVGQRVLIVGSGNSGNDILGYLFPVAKAVYLVYHSKKVRYNIPPNAEQLPPIATIAPDGTVCFENGESRVVDSIILCTGYEFHFPFLSKETGIQVECGRRITPLYKHTFNIAHPSMALLGVNYSIVAFPFFHIQAQMIVSVLLGESKLPSKQAMERECMEQYIAHLEQGGALYHAHKVEPEFPLIREFVKVANLEPLSPVFEKMDKAVLDHRAIDLWNFRKYDYRVTEASDGTVTFSKHVRKGETLV
jgi:hypothetical protein